MFFCLMLQIFGNGAGKLLIKMKYFKNMKSRIKSGFVIQH